VGSDDPLILAITSDYFLIPRLEDTARALGFRLEVVQTAADLGAEGPPIPRAIPLTEPLEGPDAAFVRSLVDRRPALLLVDTAHDGVPWEHWIQTLKTGSATRRIPVVAFGPHVEAEVLQRAIRAGAEEAVSLGKLQASLPQIIERRARRIDLGALKEACDQPLSTLGARGLELLNSGEYFEAHEVLEKAWMEAPEWHGYLYRSLLQVSVAYLQVQRANYPGAVKMLLRLKQWLEPLPDRCSGIDIAALKRNMAEFSAAVEAAGVDGVATLDPGLLRPVLSQE
jgi:CheY-like chemotaxis protein